MNIKLCTMICLALYIVCALGAEDNRDFGYGISNPLYVYTGGGPNGGISIGYSNTLQISTYMGQSGYGISAPVSINTIVNPYSEYRIVSVSQAPNPSPLKIPEGGYGYAWFVVEGQLNGVWLPVIGIDLIARDAQGNSIPCQTGRLPFQFISSIIHMQNAGVFAVPIPSTIVGNGSPGSLETITVITANGQAIAPENRQSVACEVIPYKYTEEWGYRLYAKGGAGATAGIVTATGFGGGGSGATISLDLQGLGTNPLCTAFRVHRRDDIFVGADIELGPPRLLDIGEASVEAQASFPYEIVYNFDLNDLEGLEALMAFYLITEPTIIYATSPNIAANLSTRFLSLCFQSLVANNAINGLGIARVSDEAGLDIQGSLDMSVNLLAGIPLGLKMGPSLGSSAHLGGSTKLMQSGEIQNRVFIGGEYKTTNNIGLKIIPNVYISSKFFYPHSFNNSVFPATRNVEYELLANWDNWQSWESLTMSSKIGSTSSSFKLFNLPGQMEEHKSWLKITDTGFRNYCLNALYTPVKLWNIGSAAVSMVTNNETFSQDFSNLLGTIYQQQNNSLPVQVQYGFECEDKSDFEFSLDFELPLPLLPALVVKIGGGLESTNARNYHIADGYWVKGYPYFQSLMDNPPTNNVEISTVLNTLWNEMTQGNLGSELTSLVVSEIRHRVLRWLPWRTPIIEILNDNGSYITLTGNSFPAEGDSILFRYWDWGDSPQDASLSQQQLEKVKSYNKQLRQIRERSAGMHYGIGGFYQFEASGEGWNEDPVLTIKYLDSELDGIAENTLKMYWEDEQGGWHLLNSIAVPDSNLVRAAIPYFTTYTLAPSLPQGEIGLWATPDSLIANGVSTATVCSGLLYNNDGTLVEDGSLYTILVNRGNILSTDASPLLTGLQVPVTGGSLYFTVCTDSIPVPIEITVTSVIGYASGFLSIPLYAPALPTTPTLLGIQAEHRSLRISWQEQTAPGITGYKIYYDNDIAGQPYNGTSNEETQNSPVVVGNIGHYTLTGLDNAQTYHIAITALDAYGNESTFSNELIGQPVLNAVTGMAIQKQDTGIRLDWVPSFGATSYKVFRGQNPSQSLNQMQFLGETTDSWWIDLSADAASHNFYIVISIGY